MNINSNSIFSLANLAFRNRELEKAISLYDEAIELAPELFKNQICFIRDLARQRLIKNKKNQEIVAPTIELEKAVEKDIQSNRKIQLATTKCMVAQGYLEAGGICNYSKEAVIVGWALHMPSVDIWLEDENGKIWDLSGYRYFRQDVQDKFGVTYGLENNNPGFLIRINDFQIGTKIFLKALSDNGVHILSEVTLSVLPVDPIDVAKWLFGLVTPVSDFSKRVLLIDEPIISSVLKFRMENWKNLPVICKQLGTSKSDPLVAIIIPLYGRADFIEHQLIEFINDSWLVENAEIIYVIDDPKLIEGFSNFANKLHKLYNFSFRWVWGAANRGYSGANNLGVLHSIAPVLIFMNSDVIPQNPMWAKELSATLLNNHSIGAVGPRLTYADGSIQHAGMTFQRNEQFDIWINYHPYKGLDPSLDPNSEATQIPATTGACLAMRRINFNQIGGWDCGFLVGDFEDSDLCLKLRDKGLQIIYLPYIQLTHLERQSFKMLGHDEFRQQVVIYNAARHESKWRNLIK